MTRRKSENCGSIWRSINCGMAPTNTKHAPRGRRISQATAVLHTRQYSTAVELQLQREGGQYYITT